MVVVNLEEEPDGQWFYKGHMGAMFPVNKVPRHELEESKTRLFWVEEPTASLFMEACDKSDKGDFFGGYPK